MADLPDDSNPFSIGRNVVGSSTPSGGAQESTPEAVDTQNPFDIGRNVKRLAANEFLQDSVSKQRDWGEVESFLKDRGYNPAPLKTSYALQQARVKAAQPQEKGLIEKAVDVVGAPFGYQTNAGVESTLQKFKRSYLSFGDYLGTSGNTAYSAATAKLKAGDASKEDLDTIARYEQLQKLDEKVASTFEGKLAGSVGDISKIVGEATVGGGIVGKAGALSGIGQAEKVTRLGRFGQFAGTQAATLPLTPSMYVPMAQQNNIAQGRAANDWRGYPTAVGYGYANLLVLGQLQGGVGSGNIVSQALKKGALGTAELSGVDVAAGLADEFLPKAFETNTRYGTIGQLARGSGLNLGGKANPNDLRQGLEHTAVTVLTFSALAAMHGRPKEAAEVPKAFAADLKTLDAAGLSPEAAVAETRRVIDPVTKVLETPDITREDAIQQVGEAYNTNKTVRALVDAIPPKESPAAPVETFQSPERSESNPAESNRIDSAVGSEPEIAATRSPIDVLGEAQIRAIGKQFGIHSGGKIEKVLERINSSPTGRAVLESRMQASEKPTEAPTPPQTAPEAPKTGEVIPLAKPLPPPDFVPSTATETAPRGERTHIANYKDPSRSVDKAVEMMDKRGSAPLPLETWQDSENAKGQQAKGTAAFVLDTNHYSGEIHGRKGIDSLRNSKFPLPFDPALKKVVFKGDAAGPEYEKLRDAVYAMNRRRNDTALMQSVGHPGKLAPVRIEVTGHGPVPGNKLIQFDRRSGNTDGDQRRRTSDRPAEPADLGAEKIPQTTAEQDKWFEHLEARMEQGGLDAKETAHLLDRFDEAQKKGGFEAGYKLVEKTFAAIDANDAKYAKEYDATPYSSISVKRRNLLDPLIDKLVEMKGRRRDQFEDTVRHAQVHGGPEAVKELIAQWTIQTGGYDPTPQQHAADLKAREAKRKEIEDAAPLKSPAGRDWIARERAAADELSGRIAARKAVSTADAVRNVEPESAARAHEPRQARVPTPEPGAPEEPGPQAAAGQTGETGVKPPVETFQSPQEKIDAIYKAGSPDLKQVLEGAMFNHTPEAEGGKPYDLADQVAAEWRGALEMGKPELATELVPAVRAAGGSFYGTEPGKKADYSGKYYESVKGIGAGDRVVVMRQPVVHGPSEKVLVKGQVRPIDRLAGAKAKAALAGPVERKQRAGESDWLAQENGLREQGVVTLGQEIRTQYGGIDPVDFKKSFGEGEYQNAVDNFGKSMFTGKDGGAGTGKVEDIVAQLADAGHIPEGTDPYKLLELIGQHRPVEGLGGAERDLERHQLDEARADAETRIRKENPNLADAEVEKRVQQSLKDQLKGRGGYKPSEESIPFHTPKDGFPHLGDNYPRKLSDFTDVVHREASSENAEPLLPNSNTSADRPFGNETFFSATKNLALGQKEYGGTGILMSFDANGITGKVNTKMPVWKYAYERGEAEFISADKTASMRNALRSVEFDPKGEKGKRDPMLHRIKVLLEKLVADGEWSKESLADGKVRYTRLERAPDAPPRPVKMTDESGWIKETLPDGTTRYNRAPYQPPDVPKHTPAKLPGGETFQPSNGVTPSSKTVKAPTPFELSATIDHLLDVTNYTEKVAPYGNPAAVSILKAGEAQPQAIVTQKMFAAEPSVRLEEAGHVLAARYGLELAPAALPGNVAQGFLEFWGRPNRAASRLSTLEGFSQWLIDRTAGRLDPQTPAQKEAAAYAEAFVKKNGLDKPLAQLEPLYRAWEQLPPIDKAAKLLSGNGLQASAQLSPQQKAKLASDSIQERFQDDIETNLGPLYRIESVISKGLKRVLQGWEKASTVFSQMMGQEKPLAGSYLRDGVKTIQDGKWVTIGQSEAKILEGSKPEWLTPIFDGGPSKFDLWTVARHLEGEFGRGAKPVPDAMRADYKAAYDELAKDTEFAAWADPAAERLTRAFKDSIAALEGNGIHALPIGTSDLLHKKRPDYVPTERVLTDKGWSASSGNRGERGRSILKERSGSGEQIVSPLVSYRKRLLLVASVTARQIKFNAMTKLSRQPGMGDYLLAGESQLSAPGKEAFDRISARLEELGITGADVTQMMKDIGIQNGETMFVNKPWDNDPTKNTYWGVGEDGRPTNFRVADRALYDLVTDQQVESHQLAKIVNGIAAFSIGGVRPIKAMGDLVKLGATSVNLAFHLRNIPRDAFAFWTNTIDRATVGQLPDALKRAFAFEFGVLKAGLRGETFQSADRLFQLFHDARGDQLREHAFQARNPLGATETFQSAPASKVTKAIHGTAGFLKDALNALGAGELGPRFLEFKTRLKQLTGLDEAGLVAKLDAAEKAAAEGKDYVQPFEYTDILDAMDKAAEVTVPFGRQGVLTRELNKIQPYFGPAIAGASKAIRNIRDNPKGALMGLATIAGLRLLHWATFKDEQWYEELSATDRYRNFVVPTPWGLRRVPAPRGLEVPVGGFLLPMLDKAAGKKPDVRGLVTSTIDDLAPPLPITPLGHVAVDVATNKNWRGTPIVPGRDEHLSDTDKALQYQLPYAAEQLSGGRANLSFRGAGVVPFTEVKNARRSVDEFYETFQELETARLQAKNRGEKFTEEARLLRFEHAKKQIEDISRQIRGGRVVGGRVVVGEAPSEDRQKELRERQLQIARNLLSSSRPRE